MPFGITVEFENPIFLWYLISVPFLVITHFFLLKHTKKKAIKFANFEALKRVTGERLLTKNYIILILRILILICMIFAAAGTVIWYEGESNNNDFVIAIDTSASMTALDLDAEHTRLEMAKTTAIDFVKTLDTQGEIGVVSFAGVPIVEIVPTTDRGRVEDVITGIEVQASGGTNIPGAIITGTNLLLKPQTISQNLKKGKVIILMSDGSNTIGYFLKDSIKQSIDYANKNHVKVYTITIGTEAAPIGYLPTTYNISSIINEDSMILISNSTNATNYKADNTQKLKTAYQEINNLSEKAKLSINISWGLLLASLILIFVEWGLISTRFRVVP
ncbi:MAG: VWA domain-containing protein [Candidatus Woesearchaeota archaeon]